MAAGDVTIHQVLDRGDSLVGKRMVMGTVQLDGSNPTPIALGAYLSAVQGAVANLMTGAIPADGLMGVTVGVSGATVNIYAHATNGTDPTPTASTDNAGIVSFIAWGTP